MPSNHSKSREPSLDEMLGDPLIWTIMEADRVGEHELRNMLKSAAANLATGGKQTSDTDPVVDPASKYRRGVGIMLLNQRNEVFVGCRGDVHGDAWQMPQGGIEENERPTEAAFRELREEVGTDRARIIAESKAWLRYDFPPELRKQWQSRWHGQQQKWFVMRFEGYDSDINVATEHPEFMAWKWVAAEQLPDLIVSFKRQLYLDLLRELREAGTIADAGPLDRSAEQT